MIISLLAAIDVSGGIGKDNQIPWHLSADLKRFKALTMGHHLIMGRKTYESIGRPLRGRTTIIVTRNPAYAPASCLPEACLITHSLQAALAAAQARGEQEAFIVGGGEIYREGLPLTDRLYLTFVHAQANCDVFFPGFSLDDWVITETHFQEADKDNDYPSTFRLLVRKIGE